MVAKKQSNQQAAAGETADRRVRSDARRSIQSLLEAALEVFMTSGVDAPVREIAEKAGVGVGTLYRHFPQRSDLVVAVFRNEVDACAQAADVLRAECGPADAVGRWMQRYVDFLGAKRGLAAALHSGDPAFESLPDYFKARLLPALEGLLEAAAAAGELREEADPWGLLWAVAGICSATRDLGPDHARRMVALLVDGLRFGAGGAEKGSLARS